MDRLEIDGGIPLEGRVSISGAKNAALPLICASLLTPERVTFERVPMLQDVLSLGAVVSSLGTRVTAPSDPQSDARWSFETREIASTVAEYDLVRKMRASFLVIAPLLVRAREARVSLPGGCAIGTRPIDIHLDGLRALGAEIMLEGGYVLARAPKGLRAADMTLRYPSVGATQCLLIAAAGAPGRTRIRGAAREPEVAALADLLTRMGAPVTGAGESELEIEGSTAPLVGTRVTLPGDRIEAATYLIAAQATGGRVVVEGARAADLESVLVALEGSGARIERAASGMIALESSALRRQPLMPVDIVTEPFPGFPTDVQAQWMALMTLASGGSRMRETVFENRMMHVPELVRLGAEIRVEGEQAWVSGGAKLSGASVMATDLRASASLIIAGLAARGRTTLLRLYHLDRGYERLDVKLRSLGARVTRVAG